MKTYFISGHRDITQKEFQVHYAKDIMNAVLRDPTSKFIMGDYYGVDEMAQEYLVELKKKYTDIDIVVYHMFETPRNCVSGLATKGGYKNDHHRDSAMTVDSDEDIAWVRSGKADSGTAQNLLRRKVKTITHSMKFTDAIEFMQGLLNVLEGHPNDEDEDINQCKSDVKTEQSNQMEIMMKLEDEISRTGTTIVKYYAEWCGPCKIISPILDKISETPDIKIVAINIDNEPELTQAANITSVPTLVFYKDGEYMGKAIGALNEATIMNMIDGITPLTK